MMRALLIGSLLAVLTPSAWADDTRKGVRPTTTVEVLDDKAQVDDVISRFRNAPEGKHNRARLLSGETLKNERPAVADVPTSTSEKKGAAAAEPKLQPVRSRQRNRDRFVAPTQAEPPRRDRR